MQLLVPPALPHWRERILSETTRIMLRRDTKPKDDALAQAAQPGPGSPGSNGLDTQLQFLNDALLPFRSAARPLLLRVLVLVDDGGTSEADATSDSIHAQLAAASPGSRVNIDGQTARRAQSARKQL